MKGLFFVGFEAVRRDDEVFNGFLVAVVGSHEDAIHRKEWLSKRFPIYGKARIYAYVEGDEPASKSLRTLLINAYWHLCMPGGILAWNGEFDAYLHYAGYYKEQKSSDSEMGPSAKRELPIKIEAAKALRALPPYDISEPASKSHMSARAMFETLIDDLVTRYEGLDIPDFLGAGGGASSKDYAAFRAQEYK